MRFAFSFNENQHMKQDPATLLLGAMPSASAGIAGSAGLFGSMGVFSWGTTLSTLGTVASVLGGISSASGQQQQYDATAQAAEYNEAMARNEAAAEEARRRRESQRQLASIRTGVAKSGAQMAGTPLMVLAESAELAEMDALSARWQGEQSASLYRAKADSTRRASKYAYGSSLLSGAATLAGRFA